MRNFTPSMTFVFLMTAFIISNCYGLLSWPQFRGPGGNGIAPDKKQYPVEFGPHSNLLWRAEISKGVSSPCIWEDRIFLTGYEKNQIEIICLHRTTGKILWLYNVPTEKIEKCHSFNSPASSTPVTDGNNVYCYMGSYGLVCLDHKGSEVWNRPMPFPNITFGSGTSLLLRDNKLFLNFDQQKDSCILAFNKHDGSTEWEGDRSFSNGISGWSSPYAWSHDDDEQIIVIGKNKIMAYHPDTGRELWWLIANPVHASPSTPVSGNGYLFLTSELPGQTDAREKMPHFNSLLDECDKNGNGILESTEIADDYRPVPEIDPSLLLKDNMNMVDRDRDGAINSAEWEGIIEWLVNFYGENAQSLLAIRFPMTEGDVTSTHIAWKASQKIPRTQSPLFYNDRVYIIEYGGVVRCFNSQNGSKIYSEKCGIKGHYYASPVAGGDLIYLSSLSGTVVVIESGDKFKVLTRNKIGKRLLATPALVDGRIYLRADKYMYAFSR